MRRCNRIGWFLLLIGLMSCLIGGSLSAQVSKGFLNRYDGPAHSDDEAKVLKLDAEGNIYITGFSLGKGTGSDYVTIKYRPDGTEAWVARYDGPASGDDVARAMAIDADGNIYVTGESMGVGTDMDYATIKYDRDGNQLWVARYDGPDRKEDFGVDVVVDNKGHVFVTGTSKSHGAFEFATVAYDTEGRELWVQSFTGERDENLAVAMAVDSDSNVYVTGASEGQNSHKNFATIKYSPEGRELWYRRYVGPDNFGDYPAAIAIGPDGNVYVIGRATGLTHNFDATTIKYDPDGNPLWIAAYNNDGNRPEDNVARAITFDSNGFFYVVGSSVENGVGDYLTIKYRLDGTEVWSRFYRGPGVGAHIASAVAVDEQGNVYVTGHSEGDGTGPDYATIKYNADGEVQWIERYNGPGNRADSANAIGLDSEGNVYVTGTSFGLGTGMDIATIKYTQP